MHTTFISSLKKLLDRKFTSVNETSPEMFNNNNKLTFLRSNVKLIVLVGIREFYTFVYAFKFLDDK